MKKGKLKSILILLFIVVTILFAYNLFKVFTTDKQVIDIITANQVSTAGNIEATVGVKEKKTQKSIKSNITVQMRDSNNKKVKNFKEKCSVEEGEKANISASLPKDIKPGSYTLIFTSKSGLKTDEEKVNITITDKDAVNAVISLDKGIYKPGDDVNFRVLLLSKTKDTPITDDVEISIYDANDNRVYINKAKTSEFGIVSGKFTLAEQVNSGEYKLTISSKNMKDSKNFIVNPYVTPKFEVAIETAQDTYRVDDTATISIKANYFFGEPVANATVTGTINDEEFSGLTNADGVFELTHKIKEAGKYTVSANVTDTSNYLIESSKVFYGSTDVFEIEVFAENGNIVEGLDNKIFIFTKNIDGTPVKTRIAVNYNTLNRQVVTDEAGIGILELTAEDLSKARGNSSYSDMFNITATDMDGNTVETMYLSDISKYTGTVVTLDNVKYKQNEDITLKLNSTTDAGYREVYIFKNKDLLKVISTDQDEVTFNLDDTYGLIDIYTQNNFKPIYYNNYYTDEYDDYYVDDSMQINSIVAPRSDYRYDYSPYTKKTIFIAPKDGLDIGITTDKTEYKPGEKLNIGFTSKTTDGNNTDAGLLVSILDEAVLSLADNDLTIDNIKLALQDIELTNEITAADLYAEILDGTSENKLRVALLKQSVETPSIAHVTSNNYYNQKHDEYIFKAIIFGLMFALVVFTVLMRRYKKFRVAMVMLINIAIIFGVLFGCFYEFLYYELDLSETGTIVLLAIASVIVYILLGYKLNDSIFTAAINLVLIPGFFFTAVALLNEITGNEILMILGFLLPAIVMAILVALSRKYTLNSFWVKTKEIMIQCTRSEIIFILAYLISDMLGSYGPTLPIILIIALYWLSQKIYKKKVKVEEKKTTIEISTTSITIVAFLVLALLFILIYSYNRPRYYGGIVYDDDIMTINSFEGVAMDSAQSSSIKDSSAFGSVLDSFSGVLNSSTDKFASVDVLESSPSADMGSEEATPSASAAEKTTEKVRNVFLESLAFIPELVTKDGKANAEINLSDNITTWNIQAVGNTKDGKVGFNTSTFKVFKDFFIDFSLPTNSIVTDNTSIPVTIYNYTENELTVNLNVQANSWSEIGAYDKAVTVLSNSSKMIYVPLELKEAGNQTLRIEASANGNSDIVERTFKISPNGFNKAKVVSSGSTDKDLKLDHFTTEEAIENTRKLIVKLYPSVMSQTIEGMENIFRMPTGCFEQTSSSLYPNILALKYLQDTGLDAPEVKEKALEYISKGYQRILTFETKHKGGFSLYGDEPAENVLTAFGLMELTDLKDVYDIDENVTTNMANYLFGKQNLNGSFEIDSTYIGDASSTNDLAMNAYIIWALSEACPYDERLDKSVQYLENKLNDATDNYTIALMANVFSNVHSSSTKQAINKLMEDVNEDSEGGAYVSSNVRDYWGCYGRYQNIQTTALTSMVLTKEKSHTSTNNALLQYIIKSKDPYGTWSTTQSTILALKAINLTNSNARISNQKIKVSVNNDSKEVEIKNTPLDLYELTFNKVNEENKISIDIQKGSIYYEIVEDYYVPYDKLDDEALESKQKIAVTQYMDKTSARVNDTITQMITVANLTDDSIRNGLVQIYIPQGCSVVEESLARLVHNRIIEKYEYNYNTINLYLRNVPSNVSNNLTIEYRANYPEKITGGLVRAYDYYNPDCEGHAKPINISVER